MTTALQNISVISASGETRLLSEYAGKVLLIVNVASQCGFTRQYAGLEELYVAYRDRGLRILAFPCNDFGGQEPGSMEEIQQFCIVNYGVTFELFQKVQILGEGKHPLYTYLTEHAVPAGDVQWNFEKFLISKDGRIEGRFGSRVEPQDPELVRAIERLL
jgi:glutathione peroxidase